MASLLGDVLTLWRLMHSSLGPSQQPAPVSTNSRNRLQTNATNAKTVNFGQAQQHAGPSNPQRSAYIEDIPDEEDSAPPVTPSRSRPAKHVLFNLPGTPLMTENSVFGESPHRAATHPSSPTSSTTSSAEFERESDDTHEDFSHVFNIPQPSRSHVPPSTPSRRSQDHSPRTGPHSTRKSSGPAGNKKRHAAKDIWTFFVLEDKRNFCIFCQ